MLRKLGFLVVTMGLVLPVSAAERPGSISGYVRSTGGAPQMGAVVEILGSAVHSLQVFTNEKGFFSASGLVPGIYSVKVSAPSFLPALRERVGLRRQQRDGECHVEYAVSSDPVRADANAHG